MNQILDLLGSVDQHLAQIAVKGEDVFQIVAARRLLKTAYDLAKKEVDDHADPADVSKP